MYPVDPLYEGIREAFPWVDDVGIFNCRPIRGSSSTWSQHAWGNAVDLIDPADSYASVRLDAVVAWLRGKRARGEAINGVYVGTVLWKVPLHWDHAHVERAPKMTGRPPCADGNPPDPGEDLVKPEDMQKALIDAGYDLGTFRPVAGEAPDGEPYPPGADGDWGGTSQAQLTQAFRDAKNGQGGLDPSAFVRVDVYNAHRHGEGTTGTPKPQA